MEKTAADFFIAKKTKLLDSYIAQNISLGYIGTR